MKRVSRMVGACAVAVVAMGGAVMAGAGGATSAVEGVASAQPTLPLPDRPFFPPGKEPKENPKSDSDARVPKVVALKLHADWCAQCKAMGTMFEDLSQKFDSESVLFVKLDLTNASTRTQAEYMVGALGLGGIWKELGEGKKTGTIALVNQKNKKVRATILSTTEWPKAQDELRKVLAE